MYRKTRRSRILLAIAICFPLVAIVAMVLLNAALTNYANSDKFRAAMEMETAKGLHLGSGHYETIRRTGRFTAASGGFAGVDGRKAIVSMTARNITARFNPWGVFLRRWQLDEVRVQSGEVEIQAYEPEAETVAAKPWYAALLPNRVYLKRVVCDSTDVTWRLRDQKAGFFGTRLLVTPHGRDFEYRADGGIMKMPLAPELKLSGVHVLITRELITLYNLDLAQQEDASGRIHVTGRAGLGEDKSIDAAANGSDLPLGPWLPKALRGKIQGIASVEAHWEGKNAKIESSSGDAALRVRGARVSGLPLLEKLASITGKASLRTLAPEECAMEVRWNYPRFEFRDIEIEERGKFRVDGAFNIDRKTLHGALRLGVAREYLDWLPDSSDIFAPGAGGFWWVTIHLSGTTEHPHQDLSPRIMGMLEDHPGALLEYLFKQLEEKLEGTF